MKFYGCNAMLWEVYPEWSLGYGNSVVGGNDGMLLGFLWAVGAGRCAVSVVSNLDGYGFPCVITAFACDWCWPSGLPKVNSELGGHSSNHSWRDTWTEALNLVREHSKT